MSAADSNTPAIDGDGETTVLQHAGSHGAAAGGAAASHHGASTGVAASAASAPVDADSDEDFDEAELESALTGGGSKSKGGKKSRNQKRKEKQKQRKQAGGEAEAGNGSAARAEPPRASKPAATEADDVVIEYVAAPLDASALGAEAEAFAEVFKRFGTVSGGEEEADGSGAGEEAAEAAAAAQATSADGGDNSDDSDSSSVEGETAEEKLSRRARKRMQQDYVASLKRQVSHPEVVEVHDVTAADPYLLVHLKAYRNSVPVPRHWCHKRKYLQGKRGVLKPPFALPDFITATGISKLRDTDLDTQEGKTLKAKTRERVQPKMGRIEIDYEVLHDAFFVHQTKPKLTRFGELYYEGKEKEKTMDHLKPGVLSERLRLALGMPEPYPGLPSSPPPWLINMQRYGPPPAYPHLRIPGLNAPLPPGASYGYGPGQWGRPPVDEFGQPLYGDPFGTLAAAYAAQGLGPDGLPLGMDFTGTGAVKQYWGELRDEASYQPGGIVEQQEAEDAARAAEAEAEEEAAAAAKQEAEGAAAAAAAAAAATADGTASVAPSIITAGTETPDVVQLRKGGRRGFDTPAPADTAAAPAPAPVLYQVLEQKQTGLTGGLLGSRTQYVLPGAGGAGGDAGVAITLNPEELANLSEAEIARRYAAEAGSGGKAGGEDMAGLLEEAGRKRARKDSKPAGGDAKRARTDKFKF